jgi:hypothetical protein
VAKWHKLYTRPFQKKLDPGLNRKIEFDPTQVDQQGDPPMLSRCSEK